MIKPTFLIDTHTHLGWWNSLKECENNLLYSFNNYDLSFILISYDNSEYNYKKNEHLSFEKSLIYLRNFVSRFKGMGMLIWIPFGKTKIDLAFLEKFIIENREIIYGLKFHPFLSRKLITSKRINPYLVLVDGNSNIEVKSVLTGALAGFAGTYELEVPYHLGSQIDTGLSFDVSVLMGTTADGKSVVGEIVYE